MHGAGQGPGATKFETRFFGLPMAQLAPGVLGDHADGSPPFANLPINERFAWK